ncbi:MAG: Mur ligase domain-containing protein, partial [Prevotellaceae bacterium]|nr:Mur ligase domain-containing protein [Prevotellaceae bacterium]
MQLARISQIIKSRTNKKTLPEVDISWLLTDSRSLSFPGETLFFAIRSARNDGHNYIEELYGRQVRFFVVSKELPVFDSMPDAVFLKVDNVLSALQQLAAAHRASFDIPVIGITGSNGKTVVKEWLYQLLHKDFRITRSPRSYNSQIGVPFSVWALNENSNLGIFEAGISQMGEMERLQPLIRPSIGIFCNLGDAHQENFACLKQKCEEKLKLFTDSDVLIYSSDNKLVDICVVQAKLKARLFSWGKSGNAAVQVVLQTKDDAKTDVSLKHEGKTLDISIPFTDEASVENALQCIVTLIYLNYDEETIRERILRLETVAMRLEVKNGIRNCLIINDSYNSDLNSLEIALNFLEQQSAAKKMRRTLILSDILQSGQASAELYRTVAGLVKVKNIQHIIGIGTEITAHAGEFDSLRKD